MWYVTLLKWLFKAFEDSLFLNSYLLLSYFPYIQCNIFQRCFSFCSLKVGFKTLFKIIWQLYYNYRKLSDYFPQSTDLLKNSVALYLVSACSLYTISVKKFAAFPLSASLQPFISASVWVIAKGKNILCCLFL